MFTLGVEEEYQLIDPLTRELSSSIYEIFDDAAKVLGEQVKLETHQCMVEVATKVCKGVKEIKKELLWLRKSIYDVAKKHHKTIIAASTHPFADWRSEKVTKDKRHEQLDYEYRDVANRLLIWGLHIHVAVPDPESAIHVMNAARRFLPLFLLLSTNSPFWQGRNTGLKSYRAGVWRDRPRTDIPEEFNTRKEYDDFVECLIKTHCIHTARDIWWDIRLHPSFPTIECRICDLPSKVEETVAITALFQALIVKLYQLVKNNQPLPGEHCKQAFIQENKWRATRYGFDKELVDFNKEMELSAKKSIINLLEFVDDVVDELGSREEFSYIYKIMENGTGADRQVRIYYQRENLCDVVDYLINESTAEILEVLV